MNDKLPHFDYAGDGRALFGVHPSPCALDMLKHGHQTLAPDFKHGMNYFARALQIACASPIFVL
ncbi:MAG TPA: hypothetical protein VFB72_09450 [Verrucomicrobiae bacterium]|nr:hypothetical protein [Verrucomicrobiae bacterium]